MRNYKLEEKLKEMGIKDPELFMKYEMQENYKTKDYSYNLLIT